MATTYPGTIQTFVDPSGTSLLASGPDHAELHTTHNDTSEEIQTVLGTTSGTFVLKNFTAGHFPVRINTGGTLIDTLNLGTFNSPTFNNVVLNGGTLDSVFIDGGTLSAGTIIGVNVNSGTINGGLYGTPTIGTIAVAGTVVPLSVGAGLAPTVVTLTDAPGGTISINAQAAQVFHLILGTTAGNRTLANPTNNTEGQAITLRVKQNAAATGTLVFGTNWRMNDGGTPTLGTAATYNYFGFRYNGIDSKYDLLGSSKSII